MCERICLCERERECVCMCVREREREREIFLCKHFKGFCRQDVPSFVAFLSRCPIFSQEIPVCVREYVCVRERERESVCVYVCKRERERERDISL